MLHNLFSILICVSLRNAAVWEDSFSMSLSLVDVNVLASLLALILLMERARELAIQAGPVW